MPQFSEKDAVPPGNRQELPKAKDLIIHPFCRSKKKPADFPKRVVIKRNHKAAAEPTRAAKMVEKSASVLDLLCRSQRKLDADNVGHNPPRSVDAPNTSNTLEPKLPIASPQCYVFKIQRDIAAGRLDLKGNPWVFPASPFQEAFAINKERQLNGERQLDSCEALNLILRPSLFVWWPERLWPGLRIHCPRCGQLASWKQWHCPRILHSINSQCMYITMRYQCSACLGDPKPGSCKADAPARKQKKIFKADDADFMATLPSNVTCLWDLVDKGYKICDSSVVDFTRALATRASYSAIASAINEVKTNAWMKNVVLRYLELCEALQIIPTNVPKELPMEYKFQDQWIRSLYLKDFESRCDEVVQELTGEIGDHVLILDWTVDAARQCGNNFLFNAMAGNGKILLTELTNSAGPAEVEPWIWTLKQRGVNPTVVYVDDECCGAWKAFLEKVWPKASTKLDGMHAIRRLAQTTSSTRHPLHGRFCASLSNAIYSYDAGEAERLQKAWTRDGYKGKVIESHLKKYVPRVICDATRISAAIENTIQAFENHVCNAEAGALLTAATRKEWTNLKKHVEGGCLCDPPGVSLHVYLDREPLNIGGQIFQTFRTLRGTSSLEGFHSHQKLWLGPRAYHADESGKALLTDGALRWNRHREHDAAGHGQSSGHAQRSESVYGGGLLQAANDIHLRLTGTVLYFHGSCNPKARSLEQERPTPSLPPSCPRWPSGVLNQRFLIIYDSSAL